MTWLRALWEKLRLKLGFKPRFKCELCGGWDNDTGYENLLDVESNQGILRYRICNECAETLESRRLKG